MPNGLSLFYAQWRGVEILGISTVFRAGLSCAWHMRDFS